LRFYKVRDYIVFLGDEGRDVIVVSDILKGDLTFLGPTASVGGFYLGPIYYYMMTPFLWAFNLDPVGPAYLISIIGTATVYLVYLFGKKYFHKIVGLSAAFLYATSPLIVRYSRASWNPNPLPFFALLGIYWLANGIKQNRKKLIYLSGACLGVVWQLHYLALIINLVYLLIILNIFNQSKWLNLKFTKKKIKKILTRSGLVFLGWLTTFSPFLAFEIRHKFPNTRTVLEFITRPQGAIDLKPIDIINTYYVRAYRLFLESFSLKASTLIPILLIVALIALIHASKKRSKTLFIWIIFGILGMSLYQGDIHDYYYGFLFPTPFLIAGIVFYLLYLRGVIGKILGLALLAIISFNFYNHSFFQHPPNRLIDQTQTISQMVVDMANGNPYNFALISSGNSAHAYRFFLDTSDNPPKSLEQEVTAQLIIVCEQPPDTCEPRGHPVWEIAGFGRKEIEKTQLSPAGDITVIKTIHHQSSLDMIGKPVKKG